MRNFKWNKKYLYAGVTAFLVIIACIAFYWIIQRWSGVRIAFSSFLSILSPIIGGFILAYLLSPFVKFFEGKMFLPLGKKIFGRNVNRIHGFGRGMAIFLALVVLIAIISGVVSLIIPQLYNSVQSIVVNMSPNIQKAEDWANKWLDSFPSLKQSFNEVVGNLGEKLTQWAKDSLLPQMNDIVTSVSLGVINVVKAIANIIIAVVFSVYVMFSREKFVASGKKILYSIFSVGRVKHILSALKFTDRSFMGFFTGKLLEALVVGVLCYIGCLIFGIPDALLVSVIVGITDIVPFFGPFIGAIPSAIIVLIYSPFKCLVFIILIIVLHQFDGNILGPRILSSATGLSGFWVLFALIVFGGLFGVFGMIIGVPAFAVIYMGVKTLINNKLKKSGLPSETAMYENMSYIDPVELLPITIEPMSHTEKKEKMKKIGKSAENKAKNKSGD